MNRNSSHLETHQTENGTGFLRASENPLNVERVNAIPFRFQSQDWNYHLDRLAEQRFRAAIVGSMGTGKSTLLRQLNLRLKDRGHSTHFVFLPQRPFDYREMMANAVVQSKHGSLLLVDGMERLRVFQRYRFLHQTRNAGLIVTSHQRCSLPTWFHCQTSSALMSDVLRQLDLGQPEILAAGQECFDVANGNVRDALRDLYDQFASGRFNKISS